MNNKNLLEDTLVCLKEGGKTPQDVLWVGYDHGRKKTNWATFEKWASQIDYYPGFGSEEIHHLLVVVGADFWLERGEYDGSEWWEFKQLPKVNPDATPMSPRDLFDNFAAKYDHKKLIERLENV